MGIKRGFTFYWQIKNFSFAWQGCIVSPDFTVDIMDDTVWRLCLVLRPPTCKDCIACYLVRRIGDRDPAKFEIEYELEFLDADGFSLLTKTFARTSFQRDYTGNDMPMNQNEVFVLKNYISLPRDIFVVICRIWSNPGELKEEGRCFAVTRIKVEKTSCVGFVENFSSLEPNRKKPVRIRSASKEISFKSVTVCVSEDGKICIEITPHTFKLAKVIKCTVTLMGFDNKPLECCESEFETPAGTPKDAPEQPLKFQFIRTRNELMILFREDFFYVQLEMEYSTEIDYTKVEKTEYASNVSKKAAISALKSIDSANADDEQLNYLKEERLDCLKDDLLSFYQNDILCDLKVYSRTESFRAHSLVIRARSNVFHNYFNNDHGRSITMLKFDLEADIVRRLLLFLYSDSLEDIDADGARCLYFVATQHEIPSLKRRCSLFLIENLQVSNCCDALLLADKHQDRNLKARIQEYFHQHEEVYSTNEWSDFIKSNSLLAVETMTSKYKKTWEKLKRTSMARLQCLGN